MNDRAPHALVGPADAARDRLWMVSVATFVLVTSASLSWIVFGAVPHVQDSVAQLFQARIFAAGHLWAPAPASPEFFEYTHMIVREGRWYSQYPPGHALCLVPFVWLGVPWLANPVFGALAAMAIFGLSRELLGATVARWSAAMAAVSPFLLFMCAGFMAHGSGLCAASFFLWRFVTLCRSGRVLDGAGSGAFLALLILIRPLTAVALAVPCLVYAVVSLRSRGRAGAVLVMVGALGLVALLAYNWATNGAPTRFGYTLLYGESHGLGFGKGSWGAPHTLVRGLRGAVSQVDGLHERLFEWPIGSLWPWLLGVALPNTRRLRVSWAARIFLASLPLGLAAAYVFYWYRDNCFGPRYLFEALGPVLALSGLGWALVFAHLSERIRPAVGGRAAQIGVFLVLVISAGLLQVPQRVRPDMPTAFASPVAPERLASYFEAFGPSYWGVNAQVGRTVEAHVQRPALVFVRMEEPAYDHPALRGLWFGSAFAHERPFLGRSQIIYARDLGVRNAELVSRFPGRRVYLYRGTIGEGTVHELIGKEGG